MSRQHFQTGSTLFKAGKFEEALEELNKALDTSSPPEYRYLDTRAAIYAKLGRNKDALKDARATIEAAPERWQGYARAARLFLASNKIDASNTMVKRAIEKLKSEDAPRRASLLSLQAEVEEAARRADAHRRRYTNHSANLPVEIFGEIIQFAMQDNRNIFMTMSHVCKAWRSAIRNMPLVWDTLVLTGRHTKRKAALWLEMSRGNIRELDIREEATFIPEFPSVCLNGLKWEGVQVFKTERWNPQDYFVSIGRPNGLDIIHHLEVAFWESVSFPMPMENYHHLTDLCLRTVVLPAATIEHMVSTVTELKSLTLQKVASDTIDIHNHSLSYFIEANHSLETLHLESVQVQIGCIGRDVTWDHLTTLTLKKISHLSFLRAPLPGLRMLHLESCHAQFIDVFLCLMLTNSPRMSLLNTLVLRSCSFRADALTFLLDRWHALQKLEISNVTGVANQVTEVLAASYIAKPTDAPKGPLICPQLTDINFSGCGDLETGPVVRMIRSRLVPVPAQQSAINQRMSGTLVQIPDAERIRSLKIDECAKIDPEWLGWIRSNVEQVSCVYMKKKTKFRHA